MRAVLEGVVECLSGSTVKPNLIKAHAWYDENYVGGSGGKVAAWRGWCVNLRMIGKYRTLYFNYVINPFSQEKNTALFGEAFSAIVSGLERYTCLYVTACSLNIIPLCITQGFTYKQFAKNIHPCRVIIISDFLAEPISTWVNDGVRMVQFQRDYC
jgi:hypothetical protein